MKAPIEILLERLDWKRLPAPEGTDGLYATHEGVLEIGELHLRCYMLNDGQRVFDADDIHRAFDPAHNFNLEELGEEAEGWGL